MDRVRFICAWLTALAIVLAGPAASLAECLRCPPDCPMHAPRVQREHAPADAAHAHHEAVHAEHHGVAGQGGAKKCHEDPSPKPADGPCLSGACGHMDESLARVLPDGILGVRRAPVPVLAVGPGPAAPHVRPAALPTEPPRPLSA